MLRRAGRALPALHTLGAAPPPGHVAKVIEQFDIIPLRVAKVDAELGAAIEGGCRQLVLLGAGLDTRAYRMPSLAGIPVYEVDHPATQAYKRRKASRSRRSPAR